VKLPPDVASSKLAAGGHAAAAAAAAAGGVAGTTEKSPLRASTNCDSPLYAECVQPCAAISYVLLRPGGGSATVLGAADLPPASPAHSDRRAAGRRRGSSLSDHGGAGDLRALVDRLEALGGVDVARSVTAAASVDAVAWSSVTHRGCCIALPHSGHADIRHITGCAVAPALC